MENLNIENLQICKWYKKKTPRKILWYLKNEIKFNLF